MSFFEGRGTVDAKIITKLIPQANFWMLLALLRGLWTKGWRPAADSSKTSGSLHSEKEIQKAHTGNTKIITYTKLFSAKLICEM